MNLKKYKCKGCDQIITYDISYKRYYCSENCFLKHRTRKCHVCEKDFISTKNSKIFCEKCMPNGLKEVNKKYNEDNNLLQTYTHMIYRCYNKNRNNYKHYGEKGIRVCKRWLDSFENFIIDMGERSENTTLDRIDINKDYSPENCRWANILQQRINRSRFKSTKRRYKGVYKNGNKWVGSIRHNSKDIYLGSFETKEEAAIAYDMKIIELYGNEGYRYTNILKQKRYNNDK